MAILQVLLTEITNSISNILNTTFGWATILLFGRVPRQKQTFVSVMALGAVIWILVVIGVIFPGVALFLLAFLPIPGWVNWVWIRVAMFVAMMVVPSVVGYLSFVMIPSQHSSGGGLLRVVLKGYPATVGVGLVLMMLTVLAPILKALVVARRWTTEHLPVVIAPRDYQEIVHGIQHTLEEAGHPVERVRTTWMLRLPIRVLTLFSGSAMGDLVARNLTTLRSDRLAVVVYPSDVAISGDDADAAHAREIATLWLSFSRAHLTWTAEAMKIEDRLKDAWHALESAETADEREAVVAKLRTIEADLRSCPVSYREWDILFRDLLLIELAVFESGNRRVPPPTRLVRLPVERVDRGASGDFTLVPVVAALVLLTTLGTAVSQIWQRQPASANPLRRD